MHLAALDATPGGAESLAAARATVRAATARAAAAARDALDQKTKRDYGPSAAFLPLAGSCITARVDKYDYRVCPFDRAEQGEAAGGGGHPVSLGAWAGWGAPGTEAAATDGGLADAASYRTMRFEDGAHCWNGPPRSLTVTVVCGPSDALSSVAEPSRCEYTAQLATPAACGPEDEREAAAAVERARAVAAAAARDEL